MKWRSDKNLDIKQVDKYRIVHKFLWTPRSLRGPWVRWLEFADVVEKVCRIQPADSLFSRYYFVECNFLEDLTKSQHKEVGENLYEESVL